MAMSNTGFICDVGSAGFSLSSRSAHWRKSVDRLKPALRTIAVLWRLLPFQNLQAARDLFGIGATVERRNPKITFAFAAEPAARSDHDVGLVENAIKRLPTR